MSEETINVTDEMDIEKSLKLAEELMKNKNLEMPYGSLLFWITIIRRVEKLPDDISLKDFYKFLGEHYNRISKVSAEEI